MDDIQRRARLKYLRKKRIFYSNMGLVWLPTIVVFGPLAVLTIMITNSLAPTWQILGTLLSAVIVVGGWVYPVFYFILRADAMNDQYRDEADAWHRERGVWD